MSHARRLLSRRGYNLIEMMTVISCLAVALTLTAALLHRLLRVDRAERARGVVASSLDRLAHDLRRDAHAAIGPVDRLDSRVVLRLNDGRAVEYRVREADVLRTVRQGEKTQGFESYPRPIGTLARFERAEEGAVELIRLRFATIEGQSAHSVSNDYGIEAEPGRDARLIGEVTP